MASTVNAAIKQALEHAAPVLEARGILVVARLDATVELENEPPALHEAIYTIFRGLPDRLPRGATLYVTTRDRAGGDVELTWEAREDAPAAEAPREALRQGPHGDLLDLALLGLESICRARAGLLERPDPPAAGASSSALAPDDAGKVRRRYAFLIPGRSRDPRGRY